VGKDLNRCQKRESYKEVASERKSLLGERTTCERGGESQKELWWSPEPSLLATLQEERGVDDRAVRGGGGGVVAVQKGKTLYLRGRGLSFYKGGGARLVGGLLGIDDSQEIFSRKGRDFSEGGGGRLYHSP